MDSLQYPFDSAHILQKKRSLKKQLLQAAQSAQAAGGPALLPKKVAILSGSTVGEIKPVLELFLLNAGIEPTFYEGGYGLFYENLVFDDGSLAAFAPDVLYIHTTGRNLKFWPASADSPAEADEKLEAEFAHFEKAWQAAAKLSCPIVTNSFEAPAHRNFGALDAWDARGRVQHVNRLNEKMAAFAQATPGFYIHDFAWLAARLGADAVCDDAAWYAYKYAVAPAFVPDFCHSLAALVKSLFGLTKKGVVTDLDNTLWGGIIGEVGAEGIELGSESPAGAAYADFQSYLLGLSQRGILLNVASKNETATAEAGFTRADSPLSRQDFLCFEASWNPKSESVAAIAEALNIGADSLVFVDDNPAERQEVRRRLPQVAAPLIAQPEDSVRLLDRGGLFEVSSLSADDVARGEMYRQNARRTLQQQSYDDYDDYLRSLEMSADIGPFAPQHLERITQLINKTNQFNLTTKRYTAPQVAAAMEGADTITLSGRLVDKFGDNGITTALIGRISGDTLDIELWVMSCRVFKRGLEAAMFDALVAECQKRGIKRITGSYRPTAKNLLVKDFYATIGFALTSEEDGRRLFSYELPAAYRPLNRVIKTDPTT